jgi:hypothetical protein
MATVNKKAPSQTSAAGARLDAGYEQRLAEEAEAGFDPAALVRRQVGRPSLSGRTGQSNRVDLRVDLCRDPSDRRPGPPRRQRRRPRSHPPIPRSQLSTSAPGQTDGRGAFATPAAQPADMCGPGVEGTTWRRARDKPQRLHVALAILGPAKRMHRSLDTRFSPAMSGCARLPAGNAWGQRSSKTKPQVNGVQGPDFEIVAPGTHLEPWVRIPRPPPSRSWR